MALPVRCYWSFLDFCFIPTQQVVKAYESGVKAIRQITGDLTIDKVDEVLDDLQQVRLRVV